MSETISPESDYSRWQEFMNMWVREKKPAYLVVGSGTYRVMQRHEDGKRVFIRHDGGAESFYESTGVNLK